MPQVETVLSIINKVDNHSKKLCFWDERIKLTDVQFLFELLKGQIKIDYENKGLTKFQVGDKVFFDRSSNLEESTVVKYMGIEERSTEHNEKSRVIKLEVKLSGDPTYRLNLKKHYWKIRPANIDESFTPTLLSIVDSPPYITPSRILSKELEIPATKINRTRRTNFILIMSHNRRLFIEKLRNFSHKGYNFLEYFPARSWDGCTYSSIAAHKYHRGSTGKAIINFLPSFEELLVWLDGVHFFPGEDYIILTDNFAEVFKPSIRRKVDAKLSKYLNVSMIYFGSAESVRKLIEYARSDQRIYDNFSYETVTNEKGILGIQELRSLDSNLDNPLSERFESLMEVASHTHSETLRNSVYSLSRQLLSISPNTEIVNFKLKELISMEENANISKDLLQSIECFNAEKNLKRKTFQQFLKGTSLVANVKDNSYSNLTSYSEVYRMLREGKSVKDMSFFVLSVYDVQWVLPLVFTGAISITQVNLLLYKVELKRWQFFIKQSIEVLIKFGITVPGKEEQDKIVQDMGIPYWEMLERVSSGYTSGVAGENVKARIIRLSLNDEEFVLAVTLDDPYVYVMGEEGLSMKKRIDDLEFRDRIIYFSGNRNISQDFKELLDSSTQLMATKSKMWKSHVEKYLEKHSLSTLTKKLNNLGLNISENGVRAWLSESRIGTMRPFDHFPIIAKAIDSEEFKNNALEYAAASTFLQSASKKLGRWLIKISRALVANQNIDEIIEQYPKEIQKRLLQVATNYKIYELQEVMDGEHYIKISELNIIRRSS